MKRMILILSALLLNVSLILGQTAAVDIPLTVSDRAGQRDLYFGLDPAATDGLDDALGERILPPLEPTLSWVDARFMLGAGDTDGSDRDYRTGTTKYNGTKVCTLKVTPGPDSLIKFSWNLPENVTVKIKDRTGSIFPEETVTGNSNITKKLFDQITLYMTVIYTLGNVPPETPTLSSPSNNSLGISLNPTLSWNSSEGAVKYELLAATDAAFSNIIVTDTALTALSKQVGPLANSTKYYWKVRAKNNFGVSQYSEVWNFTTILGIPVLTSPLNNALDQPTNLTFSWQPVANASTYNLQVATDNIFSGSSMVFDISGISEASKAVTGLEGGTQYYWRVKAVNAGGSGSYSTVWSFTTGLPSPLLQSPANNSLNHPTTLTLSWNSVENAVKYRLQVSTASDFLTTVIDDQNVTGISKEITGLNSSTKYYWRVNASSSAGTSPYSEVWNFTTVLSAPVLLSPADKSKDQSTTLTLSWNTVNYAESYRLQVSTADDFSTTVFDYPSITTGSKEVSGLEGGKKYYWRVKANNSGGSGPYSAVWDFSTALGIPALSSPLNNAMQEPLTLTLSWNSVPNASEYELLVSKNQEFTDIVHSFTAISELNKVVGPLDHSTKYYWKVRAKNSNGLSAYSGAWSFITVLMPPEPQLPENNSTNHPTSLTFSWNTGNGTEFHRLQIATDPNFTNIIHDDSLITLSSTFAAGSHYVTGLLYNTVYYWRVKVKNAGGASSFSEVWNFMTREKPELIAPILELPGNNSLDQPTTLTLKWKPVENAIAYRLQVSTKSSFFSTVFDDSTITATSKLIKGLEHSQVYYWRVLAKSEFEAGPYSEVWKFMTGEKMPVPTPPVLESPANNACGQPLILHLSWKQSAWAETYTLQVSKDQDFKTIVFEETTAGLTSDVITGLSKGIKYYWRVNAANEEGSSSYSAVWSFITELPAPELLCPANNSLNQPVTLTLSWKAVPGADAYRLLVGTDECFANVVYDNQNVTKTSQEITGLSGCVKYYWKVAAKLCGGCSSEFSCVWNFTTAPKPCTAPGSLVVTASAYGEVKLVWKDNSDNEVGFKVYRKEGDTLSTNPFIMIKQLEANQTAFTDKAIKPGSFYTYKIAAFNSDSVSSTCAEVTVKTITSVMMIDAAPGEYNLCQNYPNPFNPSTLIRFTIKEPVHVKLTIFNQLGQIVSELFNEELPAGTFERSWNAENVPSGFYLYELRAGSYVSVKKMLLLK